MAAFLLNNLLARLPREVPYYLDTAGINPQGEELVRMFDLSPVFRTARMFRGLSNSQVPLHLFGITSFELG